MPEYYPFFFAALGIFGGINLLLASMTLAKRGTKKKQSIAFLFLGLALPLLMTLPLLRNQ
jgi:low temperature requirement protein LtrA